MLARMRDSPAAGPITVADDGSARAWSLGELVAAAETFAGRLIAGGVRRGERLAIAAPDPRYLLVAVFGAVRCGAVPIVLADRSALTPEAWAAAAERIVRMSAARWVVRPPAGRGAGPAVGPELVVDDASGPVPVNISLPDPASVRPQELALLQFTAGSAGAPIGAPLTHAAVLACARARLHDALRAGPGDRVLGWMPLHLDLVGALLGPVMRRVPAVLARPTPLEPGRWLQAVQRFGATITYASHATLAVAGRPSPGLDLSRVRAVVCADGPLVAAALRGFVEQHADAGLARGALVPAYGAVASAAPGEPLVVDRVAPDPFHRDGFAAPQGHDPGDLSRGSLEFVASGRPLPGHRVEVVDADGEPLGEREVGELVAFGPCVDDDASGQRTGHRGYLADGRLYVTGRARDVIVVHGCSYEPHHIEREAARVPGIAAGRVVALARPGAVTDELVVVVEGRAVDPAVLTTLTAALRRQIQGALGLRVAALVQVPTGALPRTTRGDLQRARARELLLGGAWT